jgi:very-short-patch-repair endonuclease
MRVSSGVLPAFTRMPARRNECSSPGPHFAPSSPVDPPGTRERGLSAHAGGMTVTSSLHDLGYIHRRDLLEQGWRPDHLLAAIRREGLWVERRQWILSPQAPRAILLAARHGGRVACVTAAALHGAWQVASDEAHLRVGPHQSGERPDAVTHRSLDLVPAPPRTLVEPLLNALSQVATCAALSDAQQVWESALNRGLITPDDLSETRWRGERARHLARTVGAESDSGLETRFVTGMRQAGIAVRQQVLLLGRPVDALIGERLVVQIDGFRHHVDARQRRADIAHDRALVLAGYTVLRFDYHQIMNQWPLVLTEIRRAMARGKHQR